MGKSAISQARYVMVQGLRIPVPVEKCGQLHDQRWVPSTIMITRPSKSAKSPRKRRGSSDGRLSTVDDGRHPNVGEGHPTDQFAHDHQPVLAVVRSEAKGWALVPSQYRQPPKAVAEGQH